MVCMVWRLMELLGLLGKFAIFPFSHHHTPILPSEPTIVLLAIDLVNALLANHEIIGPEIISCQWHHLLAPESLKNFLVVCQCWFWVSTALSFRVIFENLS